MTVQFIELSHTIEAGMKTYPGLPEPRAEVFLDYAASRKRYAEDTEFFIAGLHLCGNTGTYVDSPLHRFRDAPDLSQLPLGSLAHLPIEVIDARGARVITQAALRGRTLAGKAVLFHTGWSSLWNTDEYFGPNPHLTGDCCAALVDAGALFAGIDSVNMDDMADLRRPAHTTLLRAGIPICEHMTNLAALPTSGSPHLHAVPIAWKGGASFPVRAYAIL